MKIVMRQQSHTTQNVIFFIKNEVNCLIPNHLNSHEFQMYQKVLYEKSTFLRTTLGEVS